MITLLAETTIETYFYGVWPCNIRLVRHRRTRHLSLGVSADTVQMPCSGYLLMIHSVLMSVTF